MSETPFYLKISFRGQDASRWVSYKYTLLAAVGWKLSDSFGHAPMPIRDKINKIREFVMVAPTLRFDAPSNNIIVDIAPNLAIPLTQIVKQPALADILEESDDSWCDVSLELELPKFVIADCEGVHTRCQDDVHEIDALLRKVRALHEENDFLRALIFRR